MRASNVLLVLLLLAGSSRSAPGQNVTTLNSGHADLRDYITVAPSGELYISNQADKISLVTDEGDVVTFAAGFTFVTGLVFDQDGNLFASDSGTNEIIRLTPQGGRRVHASGIEGDGTIGPVALVFDRAGNLFVSVYDGSVRQVHPNGSTTVVASGGDLSKPSGLVIDENGTLYAANFVGGKVVAIEPNGSTRLVATVPGSVGYLAYAAPYLYATGYHNHVIYRISMDGQISVLAGTDGQSDHRDGPAAAALFERPNGIALDAAGETLYVTEDGGTPRLRAIEGIATATFTEVETPTRFRIGPVYPNPFTDTIRLDVESSAQEVVSVTIFDLLGRVRERYPEFRLAAGSGTVSLPVGPGPAGVLLVTARTRGGARVARTIVRR